MGVHDDGDGAVVDEGDLHVGAETAGEDGLAEEGGEAGDEFFVHGNGEVGTRGMDIARAVALAGGGHEGELADHHDAAVGDICHGEVHHSLGIVEDAQLDDLLAEVLDVLVGVGILDAYEYHQSLVDGGDHGAVNGDGGLFATLDDESHINPLWLVWRRPA